MSLTDALIDRLLPRDLPPDHAVSDAAERRLGEIDATATDDLLIRALVWQDFLHAVVADSANRIADMLTFRGMDVYRFEMYVGFVPLSVSDFLDDKVNRARRGTDYVFGGVLFDFQALADPGTALTSIDLGEIDPRLAGLPMLRKSASLDFHSPPNLVNATATAWASNRLTPSVDYILTAAHCVNWQQNGQTVTLSSGRQTAVFDCATYPIDGALLDAFNMSPATRTSLPVEPMPVVGEAFEFVGRSSPGGVQGRLTMIHVLPGVTSSFSPARLQLDRPGLHGDSGALVRSRVSGRGLALYSGLIVTPQVSYAVSQGLQQLCDLFEIDLWE